jgi:hypothetical protein
MAGWRLVEGRRDVLGVRLPAPPAPQGKPVGRAVPRCGAGAIARGARQLARPYRAGAGGVAVLGLHRHQRAQRAGRGDSRPARVRGHHRGLGRAAGDRHAVATLHAPVVPRPAPEGRPCDLRRYPDALALAAPARGGQLRPEHRRDGRGRRRHSQPGVAAAVPQSLHPLRCARWRSRRPCAGPAVASSSRRRSGRRFRRTWMARCGACCPRSGRWWCGSTVRGRSRRSTWRVSSRSRARTTACWCSVTRSAISCQRAPAWSRSLAAGRSPERAAPTATLRSPTPATARASAVPPVGHGYRFTPSG